jgi:hypothetical protein
MSTKECLTGYRAGLQKWAKKHQNAPEPKIVVVVIDVPRYNPLLTYNPILQTTTYLSTIVGTFWPTINYQQNQLPTPYQSLIRTKGCFGNIYL